MAAARSAGCGSTRRSSSRSCSPSAEPRPRGARPTAARARDRAGCWRPFDARLPFTLTDGQREVGATIAADLARAHPMHRLLQGEVGSGKTVVALRAMLQVVDAGGQAALLAPTEVLAQQHHRSITAMLGPLGRARAARRRRPAAPGSRCSPARWDRRPRARRCSTSAVRRGRAS